MIEVPRIAVLDQNDQLQCFLDNSSRDATNYYSDNLHTYLEGSASTLTLTASTKDSDSKFLINGNKLAFVYNEKEYYLNILTTERDEYSVTIDSYSTSFELLNEQAESYEATEELTFVQYLNQCDPEHTLTVGTNEVSDLKYQTKFDSESTILARIFEIAVVFGAEVEFVPVLNEDYSLKQTTINIYKEHDDDNQGIGTRQIGQTLRYGVNISGITKKSDISNLFTAIWLTGDDNLTIAGMEKNINDSAGNLLYWSPYGDPHIYAVQARDRFPSNLMSKTDRYIAKYGTYSTSSMDELYIESLLELKTGSEPVVEYTITGQVDGSIGDTFFVEDKEYDPVLYLETRITEQEIHFTQPSNDKTTFGNYVEKASEISSTLLSKMQSMIDSSKTYSCTIESSNGIVFKNTSGSTTLTANVNNGSENVASSMLITWYKDDVEISVGTSYVVLAEDMTTDKARFKFIATSDGIVKGQNEVTISIVHDAVVLYIMSSAGSAFKNDQIDTVMSVVIYRGSDVITTQAQMVEAFGSTSYLEWSVRKYGESSYTTVLSSDSHLSDGGFKYTVGPSDIDTQAVFQVALNI